MMRLPMGGIGPEGRGDVWERGGIVKGATLGLVSITGNASTALMLPIDSDEADVGTDVAELRDGEGPGEKLDTLSLSRSLLLDGEGRDDVLCADGGPRRDTDSALSSATAMAFLGSGGSGRFRRIASDCVPAVGNTGGGRKLIDGLLTFCCENTTGDMGDKF